MNIRLPRTAARIAVFGGIAALGLGSTQAALASPPPPPSTFVPCNTSLSTAITDADTGAVLTLAPNCTYWLTETGLPVITKTLTIVGHNSSVTRSYADGTPSFSIFSVHDRGNLTLDDVNVRNGNGDDNGGAISNVNSFVTINGGTFSGNDGADGGAVYNDDGDGTLTVNDATFNDNDASEDGGAIYNVDGSSVTIHGGTFSDNDATDNGGAIYNDHTLTVDGATFARNSGDNGGAIYSYNDDPAINGGTFSQNYATDEGGAVYNDGIMTVTHAMMDLNTAEYGGAVYNDDDGTITLTGDMVMFNQASEEDGGGGIYNDGGTVTLTGGMIMFNTPDNCDPDITGCTD
jgi:predicted outer membrane repeat protein